MSNTNSIKEKFKVLKSNPFYLLVILLLVISSSEVFIMHILPIIVPKGTSNLVESLIDGFLLTLIVTPFLWIFVVKSLTGEVYNSQKRSQVIIDAAMNGILTIDSENRILSVNPAVISILNLSREEIMGKNYKQILGDIGLEIFEKNQKKEILYKTRLGTEKIINVRGDKSIFENEAFTVLFLKDETEKRKIETELLVRRGDAEAMSRLAILGEMTGGIAHEINTPLSILKLLIGQIERELDSIPDLDLMKQITKKMSKTTERIAGIVRSMRNVSRNCTNDPLVSESLKQIIQDMLSLTNEKFNNHKVEVSVNNISEDIFIKCRASEVGQVLLNFLSNAYDAIEKLEEKWIKIDIQKNSSAVQIIITDSGNGIPADVADKIFNPFFTTKPIGRGTGLGLSISHNIIQKHGGSIRLNSSSRNTQFIIELPISY